MSSRETILTRIREANRAVDQAVAQRKRLNPEDDSHAAPAWEYGRPTPMPDVMERFVERVEDYKAVVERVTDDGIPEAIGGALRGAGVTSAVVPDGIPPQWLSALDPAVAVRRDDPPLSHADLNATGAVITDAEVGIAETGTIVLDHGPGRGRRALSLVPDLHVCVIRADQVVSDVPEAVARVADALRDRRPLTCISGPSATSDIELSRVEGVHGPRTLHVLVVG